jgi:hypothetical protein
MATPTLLATAEGRADRPRNTNVLNAMNPSAGLHPVCCHLIGQLVASFASSWKHRQVVSVSGNVDIPTLVLTLGLFSALCFVYQYYCGNNSGTIICISSLPFIQHILTELTGRRFAALFQLLRINFFLNAYVNVNPHAFHVI